MTEIHVVHVVCTGAFAGVERYVLNSALSLREAGCTVTVVGGAEVSMRSILAANGVEWRPGRTPLQALRSLRRIPRSDVINSHMTNADLVGVIVGMVRRIPVVSTRHFASRRGSNPIFRLIASGIMRRIVAQIAISEFVSESVEGDNSVVRTGVDDLDRSRHRREPVVLVLQRLEAEKRTEVALRAWAQVADRGEWRMAVAGEGSELDSLRALAEELGVAGSVDFLGFRSDVGDLLGRASVLVAPTPREGLGLAVIEAMAHGLPVVACGTGGHAESVGAVEGAAVFAPDDAGGAAAELQRLMNDPEERERYGEALRERQRSEFSVQRQTEGTLRILSAAVKGRTA